MKTSGAILLCFVMATLEAKDLRTFGETFSIREKSLLHVIQAKLESLQESGAMEIHQQKIKERLRNLIYRPRGVEGITRTTKPRIFIYDPSLIIPYDIKDHEGQLIQAAGTRINPLDTVKLSKALLFIDGEDQDQVAWAFKQYEQAMVAKPKIILVKGSPFQLMEQHDLLIYFDQSGVITRKLGITQVPARVTQSEQVLKVEEVFVDEL